MCADSYLKVERISPSPCAESQSHVGFSTTADSDIKPSSDFERLAIHVDMGELSYMHQIAAHNRGDLPERGIPPTSPAAVGCSTPEAAAYSTAASFNSYTLTYDSSSLPTPVSIAGSPSMAERQASKMAQAFSHDGAHMNQPSPPPPVSGAHIPEWYSNQGHAMISSSHPSSPMSLHPSPGLMQMHGLEASQPQEPQTIPVDNSETFYWGSYRVSSPEPKDEVSPHMASSSLFSNVPQMPPHIAPSALLKNNNYAMQSSPAMPLGPTSPPVPLLSQAATTGGITTQMAHMPVPNTFTLGNPPTPLIVSMQPYKRNARNRPPRRAQSKKRQRPPKKSSPNTSGEMDMDPVDPPSMPINPVETVTQSPRIALGDKATDADRYLLEARYEELHHKGRDMWARIRDRFRERYPGKDRPALQMQLNRLVLNHGIWTEHEDKVLQEAVAEYDEKRYEGIVKLMKARGGCQLWDWKPCHIAKRLVELGEEDYDPKLDGKGARRRRKERKRQQELQSQQGQADLWNPGKSTNQYDERGRSVHTTARLSAEEAGTIFDRFYTGEEESSEPELMHVAEYEPVTEHVGIDQHVSHAQSSRVAKQACDQMIAKQHRDSVSSFYHNPLPGHHQQM